MVLGKAHRHGGNVQAVLAPHGFPLWVSEVEPGSVHDITAARAHALPALYPAAAAGLPALADPGYEGAGIGIVIPVRQPPGGRELDVKPVPVTPSSAPCTASGNEGSPCSPAAGAPCSITASPTKIGDIARAALVLTHFEHGYIT